jgi:cytochrome c biogenesis protein CcdA
MFGTALLGILSWIIAGLVRDGTSWVRYPPLYLVVTFPFLFATSLTLAVSFFQGRFERRRQEQNGTTSPASRRKE